MQRFVDCDTDGRHREERSDVAIQLEFFMDCHARLRRPRNDKRWFLSVFIRVIRD